MALPINSFGLRLVKIPAEKACYNKGTMRYDRNSTTGTTNLPIFIRLPAPTARCPYTGLSRTTLTELTVPSKENGYRPPVKSHLLAAPGAKRGIRIIDLESLMAYLSGLGATAEARHVQEV